MIIISDSVVHVVSLTRRHVPSYRNPMASRWTVVSVEP